MDGIKGAIFDLDGTLFDSLWMWEEIDKRFLGKRGFDVPDDYSAKVSAMTYRQTADYTIERFGLSDSPQALMDEWHEMSKELYATEVKLKDGAKEFLDVLLKKGIKLGVATSSTPEMYEPALKNNGVRAYFCAVADTTSRRSKEFPDVYLDVAAQMGLSPFECVVFEDLPKAIDCARNAGFKTVAIFDKHFTSSSQAQADEYVQSFAQLKRIFG